MNSYSLNNLSLSYYSITHTDDLGRVRPIAFAYLPNKPDNEALLYESLLSGGNSELSPKMREFFKQDLEKQLKAQRQEALGISLIQDMVTFLNSNTDNQNQSLEESSLKFVVLREIDASSVNGYFNPAQTGESKERILVDNDFTLVSISMREDDQSPANDLCFLYISKALSGKYPDGIKSVIDGFSNFQRNRAEQQTKTLIDKFTLPGSNGPA